MSDFLYDFEMVKITDTLQQLCNSLYRYIPQSQPSMEALSGVQLVAHRGAWDSQDRLENTLPAFDHCLNKKIWAIEYDIRWTADDVPVIHHDTNTTRVFNMDLSIANTMFARLRERIPAIPQLAEVIGRYNNKIHHMIELKNKPSEKQLGILQEILTPLTPIADYHFMSLDIDWFSAMKQWNSKCFVSVARTNINQIYKETLQRDLGGFTGQYLLVSDKMRSACLKHGITVGTGFPDSKNLLFREVNRGIPWVFTNRAVELSQYL